MLECVRVSPHRLKRFRDTVVYPGVDHVVPGLPLQGFLVAPEKWCAERKNGTRTGRDQKNTPDVLRQKQMNKQTTSLVAVVKTNMNKSMTENPGYFMAEAYEQTTSSVAVVEMT